MHSRMEDQMNQQSSYVRASEDNQPITTNASTKKEQAGDYIDFEELK